MLTAPAVGSTYLFGMNTFAELQSREIEAARAKHNPINSAHEGYSVILEELDEFWEEVRKKRSLRDKKKMVSELVQIAAMAQRTAEDVCMRDGCAACDRGDFQLGHADGCLKASPNSGLNDKQSQ
jgi:vacuolar-type H+-ATPase catalytic subunit A/Vma1